MTFSSGQQPSGMEYLLRTCRVPSCSATAAKRRVPVAATTWHGASSCHTLLAASPAVSSSLHRRSIGNAPGSCGCVPCAHGVFRTTRGVRAITPRSGHMGFTGEQCLPAAANGAGDERGGPSAGAGTVRHLQHPRRTGAWGVNI